MNSACKGPSLVFVFVLLSYLFAFGFASTSPRGADAQLPLISRPPEVAPRNFSVGFSLQSSFGAAAVIFESPDGQLETHSTIYYGGPEYRRVMATLSLESSRHFAPPYDDDGQYWADQPRQAARAAMRALGFPASYEVGILAHVVRHLRSQLESAFGIHISEAVFTASHLVALYQDDLEDVATHLSIHYVTPKNQFRPFVWETASAYAGHGLGLCQDWRNEKVCAEEEAKLPDITLLTVHYSRNALTVSLAEIGLAVGVWEPEYRHTENFTLGRDALVDYSHPRDYWEAVERELLGIMTEFPGFRKPHRIMITGDAADAEFMEVLKDAMMNHMGRVPEIISDESVEVAAKGAAEFMRRGPAPWS